MLHAQFGAVVDGILVPSTIVPMPIANHEESIWIRNVWSNAEGKPAAASEPNPKIRNDADPMDVKSIQNSKAGAPAMPNMVARRTPMMKSPMTVHRAPVFMHADENV